jgi:hypothetical protein
MPTPQRRDKSRKRKTVQFDLNTIIPFNGHGSICNGASLKWKSFACPPDDPQSQAPVSARHPITSTANKYDFPVFSFCFVLVTLR